jgi:hypothetical protein
MTETVEPKPEFRPLSEEDCRGFSLRGGPH